LSNSIKYKSENRESLITITTEKKRRCCCDDFKDNGIGIDLEETGLKFWTLSAFPYYPDSKGLGLYLVKSQVETMGVQ
jgi:sensor histidine kinase regulating citrate/malate metabolism